METNYRRWELACSLVSLNHGVSCSDFSWFSRAYVVQLGRQWGCMYTCRVDICGLTCINILSVSGLMRYNDTKYLGICWTAVGEFQSAGLFTAVGGTGRRKFRLARQMYCCLLPTMPLRQPL